MLSNDDWQLKNPIEAIIFDCDGTLSSIEGIDELAVQNQVGDEVSQLTAIAMGMTGINPELYQQRLVLVKPNQQQVHSLADIYFANITPHTLDVIKIFKRLNKSIYVLSAGLKPAVEGFCNRLTIPKQYVFAVDIQFDAKGNYLSFDATSPLVHNDGKRQIISHLKTKYQRIAHIGDGMNDYVAHDLVDRFIGYGGTYYRENIASLCEFYIKSPSLASLLPLLLTQDEYMQLTQAEQILGNQRLADIIIRANIKH